MGHSLEREREGGDAATVGSKLDPSRIDFRRCGDLEEHGLLTRMVGEPVALARPPPRATESEQPSMLAGAIVLERRGPSIGSSSPALEVVFGCRRPRKQAAHRLELFWTGEVRRAGDRDVPVVEVGSRPQERKRLDRLRRAPKVGDELRVSCRADDLAAGHGDCMHAVARLDDVASGRLDDDRLHGVSVIRCERSVFSVCSGIIDRIPNYDLEDVLVVEEPQQLRALADPFRGRIITLLRERSASTTELAKALETPKGTVGHHLKVLEKAGLVRVVRTRKVRALTEKYYGRVARLFVLKTDDSMPDDLQRAALAAMMLRQASDELIAARVEKETSAILHVRLAPRDVLRFQRRLNRLVADFQHAEEPDGEMHALAFALFEATAFLPQRDDDA